MRRDRPAYRLARAGSPSAGRSLSQSTEPFVGALSDGRRPTKRLSVLVLALAALPALAGEFRTERVQFARGGSAATIQGQLHGDETVEYLLGAGAGQTLEITLETAHGATYFNVFAPGAEPGRDAALFIGETGGKRFAGKLPSPGDYRVQVYMMRSAARRNETAAYKLEIAIVGVPNRSAKAPESGPWPVETDASGDLPCSTGGETLDLRCPFRVKRNSFGATLWVIRPGETRDPKLLKFDDLRVLAFEKLDGQEKFTVNGAEEVSWKRDDDNWIVTVGDRERFWIPDAAIWGG